MLTSFSGRCITRTINASLGRRRRRKPEKAKYLSGAFRSVHVASPSPLPPSLAVAPT